MKFFFFRNLEKIFKNLHFTQTENTKISNDKKKKKQNYEAICFLTRSVACLSKYCFRFRTIDEKIKPKMTLANSNFQYFDRCMLSGIGQLFMQKNIKFKLRNLS